jgi:hypothetical protein
VRTVADKGRVSLVEVMSRGRRLGIAPDFVIDCTGGGTLARSAGAKLLGGGGAAQSGGFGFSLERADAELFFGRDHLAALRLLYKTRSLGPAARSVTFMRTGAPDELMVKFSAEAGSAREKAAAAAREIFKLLSESSGSLRNSRISHICSRVLSRETGRVRGEYVLDEDDVLGCVKHADGAVKNNWPIELWRGKAPPSFSYLPAGGQYTIPLRSLLVKGFTNLMAAGRCISASRKALGSARVIGACLSTGEFCGLSCAAAAERGTRLKDTDIDRMEFIRKKHESL